jgi:hypothetical protein
LGAACVRVQGVEFIGEALETRNPAYEAGPHPGEPGNIVFLAEAIFPEIVIRHKPPLFGGTGSAAPFSMAGSFTESE